MIAGTDYYDYRTKNGAEVDLIIEGSFGTLPVEVKFGMDTKSSRLDSLKRFINQQNLPLGIVINNSEEIRRLSDRILQIPAGFI